MTVNQILQQWRVSGESISVHLFCGGRMGSACPLSEEGHLRGGGGGGLKTR